MAVHEHEHQGAKGRPRWRPPGGWVLAGFLAIGAYFLIMEHRAHVVPFLPYAFLLACPLMHMFHRHGGHGGHNGNHEDGPDGRPPESRRPDDQGGQ